MQEVFEPKKSETEPTSSPRKAEKNRPMRLHDGQKPIRFYHDPTIFEGTLAIFDEIERACPKDITKLRAELDAATKRCEIMIKLCKTSKSLNLASTPILLEKLEEIISNIEFLTNMHNLIQRKHISDTSLHSLDLEETIEKTFDSSDITELEKTLPYNYGAKAGKNTAQKPQSPSPSKTGHFAKAKVQQKHIKPRSIYSPLIPMS